MKRLWAFIKCTLWYGHHDYVVVSPEDHHGKQLAICRRCGHKTVDIFWHGWPIEEAIKSKSIWKD